MMPEHGEIGCDYCRRFFENHLRRLSEHYEKWWTDDVTLVNNPCSWGSTSPEVVILGFSKGNTQNKALELHKSYPDRMSFEDIAFYEPNRNSRNVRMREKLQEVLVKAGILRGDDVADINTIFLPSESRFHIGSLVRCSLSVNNGQGGVTQEMKCIVCKAETVPLVGRIMRACVRKWLLDHIEPGTFTVMVGISSQYVALCRSIFERVFEGEARVLNPLGTAYRVNHVVFAHVAHLSGRMRDDQFVRWLEGRTKEDKMGLFRDAWRYYIKHERGR